MIAVDVMGGDHAPRSIIEGALEAAKEGVPVLLCGRRENLEPLLIKTNNSLPIEVEFCEQQILMDEEPGRAVREKANSSLVRAMKAVVSKRAKAFFSAGNSGSVLVASVLLSGKVCGIQRPAVGVFLPTTTGSVFCLDVGVNVDCKPEYLYQFALIGHAYVRLIKGIEKPKIALLSNGHEAYKGCQLVKETYDRLTHSGLNFIGNIEARDLGGADVIVCDGFVGNVLLKTMQGTVSSLFSRLQTEVSSSWLSKLFLLLNNRMLRGLKQRFDYASTGGALLLGVNHPVILAHGRSDSRAIKNGILFAHRVVCENRIPLINTALSGLIATSDVGFFQVHQGMKNRDVGMTQR